jgi:hypothetical protein
MSMLTQHKNKIQAAVSFIICIIGACLISPGGIWYVDYPENSWSSICYALPNAPLSIKGPLLTLSIVSFGLWAHSTIIVNFIDVTCIFWVIIIISLSLLPKSSTAMHALKCFVEKSTIDLTLTHCFKSEISICLSFVSSNIFFIIQKLIIKI